LTQIPDGTSVSQAQPTDKLREGRDWTPRLTAVLNRLIRAITQHWLLMFNTAVAAYALLPVVAPVFMATGHPGLGRLIHTLYGLTCHQLPERSFFLFGARPAYTLQQLKQLLGPDVPLRYLGDALIGYKVAVCERDTAIYLAFLAAGVAFALVRRRVQPLAVRAFLLFCLPMSVDGLGQLLGVWESTWWSRVATGVLFGIACVWLAYPHVEAAMREVLTTLEAGTQRR
jgi:uncharacterized membrane protein